MFLQNHIKISCLLLDIWVKMFRTNNPSLILFMNHDIQYLHTFLIFMINIFKFLIENLNI